MKEILILVEGQTEETFVRDVLGPHLLTSGVYLKPVIVSTKRAKSGHKFKGGISSYGQVRNEVLKLLRASHALAVTTMIDYYGLPKDFPSYGEMPAADCYKQVQFLESAFGRDIGHHKFIPFIVLHEFEALLFVDTEQIAKRFPGQPNVADHLAKVTNRFNSPEEINDRPTQHPSARILECTRGYQKPLHGSIIAQQIGVNRMRQSCPHFDSWLKKLENL